MLNDGAAMRSRMIVIERVHSFEPILKNTRAQADKVVDVNLPAFPARQFVTHKLSAFYIKLTLRI
jgi:hypothetical protein